jgi:alpha-L-fucosidase
MKEDCMRIMASFLIGVALASSAIGQTTAPAESKEQRGQRMSWWRQARFGMFIHWGLYSVPGGVYHDKDVPSLGEWIMNNASIPCAEYAGYAKQFNPVRFDADQWVAIAKAAGMKYIVITSKHHDGFAMFKSAASPFNIVDATPFGRDVIRELDDAARKAGIRFGVYYSQSQDWNHAGGYAYGRAGRKNGQHWDPAQDGSFDDYLNAVAIPQVKELLSRYPLDVFWWDTAGGITPDQATKLHELLALQPKIISNNRLGGGFRGDTETPEQRIPATGYADGRDWETCMTINDTWGYKAHDTHWKSTETLIRNLVDIASKGGNYLLNVGPDAMGEIPPPEVERLAAMGKWLSINGESIYGTSPNPFSKAVSASAVAGSTAQSRPTVVWDWRATTKPGKLFIHIFEWPASGVFHLPATSTPVLKAYLLTDQMHAALSVVAQENGDYDVHVGEKAPDEIDSVMCVELKQP